MRKPQEIRASIKSINRLRKQIRDERRRLDLDLVRCDMYWKELQDELRAAKAEGHDAKPRKVE